VTVTDGNSCTSQGSIIVETNLNPPIADFTSNVQAICQASSINFTDLSTNSPQSWYWEFAGGNPASSTEQNPSVSYNTPGIYQVKLTVTNPDGSDTEIKNNYITVNQNPSIDLGEDIISCPNETVVINAGGTGLSYLWSNSTTSQSININTAGDYSLTVTDANSCTASDEINVSFYPQTSLTMSATPETGSGANDGTASVIASGTSPFTYLWNNNETSSTISGLSGGNYTVTVTDGNSCTSQGSIIVETNLNPPIADFTSNVQTICQASSINFTDLSTNSPQTWYWEFAGGNPASSTEQNPNVSYNTPGIYQVKLTVTNPDGSDTEIKNNYIHINSNPIAFAISPSSVCEGENIQLYGMVADADTYSWTGPNDFTSNQQSPIIINSQANHSGTYILTVSNSETTCYSTANTELIVNEKPNISANNTSPICEGEDIELSATGTGGTEYFWQGPYSFTSTEQNPVIQNAIISYSGEYTVKLTNTNTGCSTSASTYVSVNQNPLVSASASNNNCEDSNASLTATGFGGTNYSWSGPNSFYSEEQNPIIENLSIANNGYYTVSLTNTNTGCLGSAEILLSVNPKPNVNLGGNQSICEGETTTLFAGNGFSSYLWNNNSTGQYCNVSTEGTYSVTVTNTYGCAGSDAVYINLYDLPELNLPETLNACLNEVFTFELDSEFDYIEWSNGSNENVFQEVFETTGEHEISVFVMNEYCSNSESITVIVDICDNILDDDADYSINIYPNPTKDITNIIINNYWGQIDYSILDAQGKVIFVKQAHVQNEFIEELDLYNLKPGMYFIKITTKDYVKNLKLIKK
ncbi:MAG: PKD domain-containing protein, partial [Bacteroidales bacterium]|nr:PKD domain-containing protein [Bacteroidales bacterium]